MKPIIFNAEMLRAIFDGRKTVTRRVCKIEKDYRGAIDHSLCTTVEYPAKNYLGACANFMDDNGCYRGTAQQKYTKGDILYVKEKWNCLSTGKYVYKADGAYNCKSWRSSIHMPREAARFFLRVTDVRLERLQDITAEQIQSEGLNCQPLYEVGEAFYRGMYSDLWDSTIKQPNERDIYGWDANPWVWVIEFE